MLAEMVIGTGEASAYPLNDDRREAIRVALALSVHPDQPLGPQWLHGLLAPMRMSERDRRWTAEIRGMEYVGTPFSTLIRWCRTAPHELLASANAGGRSFARLAAVPLMWALSSSDRFLRDTATRALVSLADHDSAVVIDLIEAVGDVDDNYVIERVLAVACASQLRRSADMSALAPQLVQLLGHRGLPDDVLSRDYLAVTLEAMASSTNGASPQPDEPCTVADVFWSGWRSPVRRLQGSGRRQTVTLRPVNGPPLAAGGRWPSRPTGACHDATAHCCRGAVGSRVV
jgi:hypothetical protein